MNGGDAAVEGSAGETGTADASFDAVAAQTAVKSPGCLLYCWSQGFFEGLEENGEEGVG